MATLARGTFIKLVAGVGAGLSLGAFATAEDARSSPFGTWVRIEPDDRIVITINKSEMGQGVATGLPTILADELDAPLERIIVDFAPAEPRFFDPGGKTMSTGGSTSIAEMWMPLRTAGATARAMLIAAAAKEWSVEPKECTARAGIVYHPASNRSASYGKLAAGAATLPVPENVSLKLPPQWNLIGKHSRRLDIAAKVNGKARYGMDIKVPGMLYASIKRSPVFGGKVRAFDPSQAKKIRGVLKVVEISSGVAAIAENTWAAFKGAEALRVTWDEGPNARLNTAELFAEAERLSKSAGIVAKKVGDVEAARGRVIEATYKGPYLAHAAMEPMNCTARVTADSCEVWAPTQNQTAALAAAQAVTGFATQQIAIHTVMLGGGFGRRLENDYVFEAVELAKKIGRPVKVVWTREDDIQHDFYRPMSLNVIRGTIDGGGKLIALDHTVVQPSALHVNPRYRALKISGVDYTAVNYVANLKYEIPNFRASYVEQPHHDIMLGPLRAPGANWNAFVVETFIDELAHAAGRDPLEFRLALLEKTPRLAAALRLAAERSGWGRALPNGRAHGLVGSSWNGSYAGVVAEVSIAGRMPVVHNVTIAVDVGTVVNPEIVVAQAQSAINYGLGMAMTAKITIENGRVKQRNFYDYTVLRGADAPVIEVHLIPNSEPPTGIGELGTPPIAPAIANAVFRLTGKRVRMLPFSDALA